MPILVHPLGKSLHLSEDKSKPKQLNSSNNRLESATNDIVAFDEEIKRWQDILSADYNKWLFCR